MPARVKVFTGWDNDRAVRTDPAYARRPMVLNAANHSPSAKVFLGTTIAAGTPGAAAMPDGAGHHRQPPQRRPLHRPAADPAARHQQPQRCLRGPGGCRVRQQRQRHAGRPEGRDQGRAAGRRSTPRTFNLSSPTGLWNIGNSSDPASRLGQSPLRSPSVSNFFRPGYVPPNSALGTQNLAAPEFQITNESNVVAWANWAQTFVQNGVGETRPDYTAELAIASDAAALVRRVALLLSGDALSAATAATITTAVGSIDGSTDAGKLNRGACRHPPGAVFTRVPGPGLKGRRMHNAHATGGSRRAFLQRAGQLSLTGIAAPWALNLAAMAEAAARSATDYKALVCVFLYGANDHGNTLPPYDAASHAAYSSIRGSLATPRANLAATALTPRVALPGGRQMALAPELAPLKPVFDAGRMGVLLNVGTLIQPTTLAQYNAKSVSLPPKLFSHNDQQSVWATCSKPATAAPPSGV